MLEWTPDMSVGVPALDLDHRQLVTLLNMLADTVAENDTALTQMLMASLVREAQSHFGREEAILAKYAFPQRGAHGADHILLVRKLQQLEQLLAVDTAGVAADVLQQAIDLFIGRLLPEDMKYKAWFAANGVRATLRD